MAEIVPSDREIEHAIRLLREVPSWEGAMAAIPIDSRCRWDDGSGPCDMCLHYCCVLLQEIENQKRPHVHLIALCSWHARCLQAGLKRWRTLQ